MHRPKPNWSILSIPTKDPLTVEVLAAIRTGDVVLLQRLLEEHPGLSTARIVDTRDCKGSSRSLLYVATDWPGHFPNSPETLAVLIAAGAEVNAQFTGPHTETPLHWAASSDDVAVLDAPLDAGADIEAPGAVIGGGTPLADAVGFGQWSAAGRLVQRGARTTPWQAAALVLMDRVEKHFATGINPCESPCGRIIVISKLFRPTTARTFARIDSLFALASWSPRPPQSGAPVPDEITNAFWCACHGGQRQSAEYILGQGADINWIGYDGLTPVDAARRSDAGALVEWLISRGAISATERK